VYLDSTSIGARFGTDIRDALCPGAPGPVLADVIAAAEGVVESALREGGYTAAVPSSVYASTAAVPKQIAEAALGQWWAAAHVAKGIALPTPTPEPYASMLALADRIRTGEVEIDGAVAVSRAVGGVTFTDSESTAEDARLQIFSREEWSGW
jgi:hypothetical protein